MRSARTGAAAGAGTAPDVLLLRHLPATIQITAVPAAAAATAAATADVALSLLPLITVAAIQHPCPEKQRKGCMFHRGANERPQASEPPAVKHAGVSPLSAIIANAS